MGESATSPAGSAHVYEPEWAHMAELVSIVVA
jgi:hypothetical protein